MITEEIYGHLPDGREVKRFLLTNAAGLRVGVIEYGAILASVETPDRDGNFADLTLGYDTLEGWLGDAAYVGATVGRFGNRIAGGRFRLDGKKYRLATNDAPAGIPCHLHGGDEGFGKKLWKGRAASNGVELTYLSEHGEEGYPGNLSLKVTYRLNDRNELTWEAEAVSDAATPVNLVQHAYWNLSGDPSSSIDDHLLTLHARHYLPVNAGLIPTGEIASVKDTPMDFLAPQSIAGRLRQDFPALLEAGGYDHAWLLDGYGVRLAALLEDPKSGRSMEVSTDQPAIQFYGGNLLDGSIIGKQGVAYARHAGLCLETEALPDAPNQPSFPSSILRPGETYRHRTVFRFGNEKLCN